MNKCLGCTKPTLNPKFCNKSCSAIYNNKLFPKRSEEGRCSTCNTKIPRRSKYCAPCRPGKPLDLSTITYGQMSGERIYQKNSRIRDFARQIYKKSDKPKHCIRCGYDKHFEVCHIQGISNFPSETLVSTINSLDNLMALCPNCHWEFDSGKWTLNDLDT